MTATTRAMAELETYCRIAVRHSYDQYEKHGTLHNKAVEAFRDPTVWDHKWVPDDFDVCEARTSPIWQAFTREQKLAWSHLQWGLDYSAVAQGERQIIVLNNYAVADYAHILPSVCELEKRESFEEVDHIEAFMIVLEGCRQRYFPHRKEPLSSMAASGFGSERVNRVVRHGIGVTARKLFGRNFPTLFFLARGMKTHGFKPFENAIAQNEEGHPVMRMISHLHRLDESRHMATSLNLARLSNDVLESLPRDNILLFKLACQAAFPRGRSSSYRLTYWRSVLDEAVIYADIPAVEREQLYAHLVARCAANLESLHEVQTRLTRQANKRIIEDCGLPPKLKRVFVDHMRGDPAYASTVDAVDVESFHA